MAEYLKHINEGDDYIRLVINEKEYFGFTVNNISLMYNAICSTFSFSGLSDYSPEPYSYAKVKVYIGNILLLEGNVINNQYTHSAKPTLVSISGYSKAGILEDCTIPLSAMPMQLDNMSLNEICNKLLPLFGLTFTHELSVDDKINKDLRIKVKTGEKKKGRNKMAEKFEKVNFEYDMSIKEFIVKLATEKGIFVNHLSGYYKTIGDIHFTDSSSDNLTSEFLFDENNIIEGSLSYDGQIMHSEISILGQTKKNEKYNAEYTLNNPYVKNISRPIIHTLKYGGSYNVSDYARLKLSEELKSIKLTLKVKKFVMPGILITVKSDKLKIKKGYDFFVEQTDINSTPTGNTYTLTCTLKDVYSVKPVTNIFEQ